MLKSYGFLKYLYKAYQASPLVVRPPILYNERSPFSLKLLPIFLTVLHLDPICLSYWSLSKFIEKNLIKNSHDALEDTLLLISICAAVTAASTITFEKYRIVGKCAGNLTPLLNRIIQLEIFLELVTLKNKLLKNLQ